MIGKRLSLAAVTVLSMLTLWGLESCSKNNTTSYTTDGTVTATLNGGAWSAKSYVVAGYVTIISPQIIVEGDSITNGDTARMQIAVPYILPVNQLIPFDTTAYAGALGISYSTHGKLYQAFGGFYDSHGAITLSTADTVGHHVAGTFNGVLYATTNDSVVITNGAFNTTYQVP